MSTAYTETTTGALAPIVPGRRAVGMPLRASLVVLLGVPLIAACTMGQDRIPDVRQERPWITLAPLEWEAVFKFDESLETTESAGTTTKSEETKFREGVRLKQDGYSLDPGILNFSVEIEPTFEQDRLDTDGRSDSVDTAFLNFNLDIRALEDTPGPFSYFANATRSTGTTSGSLGTRSDFETMRERIGANWKTQIFPSTLEFEQRSRDESFRTGITNTTIEIEEVERTVRFRGHSRKMNVLAEYSMFDDQVAATDRDRTVMRLQVLNNYRWGKGSELRTNTDFFKRTDTQPIERLRMSSYARLQHTGNLYSTYDFEFFSSEQTTSIRRNTATVTLNHDLYENLFTEFRTRAVAEDFDVGTQDEYETNLTFTYNKNIFWGGRLLAGLGSGYRLTDRKSTGGLLQVVDESHTVDITRTLTLSDRLIQIGTIVVTDITGAIVLTEGVDYIVIAISQSRTQLDVLAGGTVNVGDTILVSYRHATQPTQKFSAIPYHYDINLDFDWISVFHRNSVENETLISGAGEEFLFDQEQRTTGIELRWARQASRAVLRAERRFTIAGDIESDSDVITESLFHSISPRLSATLSASQNFIATRDRAGVAANRFIDVYSANATVNWRPLRGLSVRPFAGGWIRKDKGISDENFFTTGVDARWRVGKFDMSLRFNHDERSGNAINPRKEDQIKLTIIRKSI